MTSFLLSMAPTVILTFDYVFYTLVMRQLCVLKKELGFFQFLCNQCLMLQSIVSCRVNPDNHSIPFCVHFVGGDERMRKGRRS